MRKERILSKFSLFFGAGTALCTPFEQNGELDLESYRRLLRFQLDEGIDALLVCGTTGEAATLSADEHFSLVRFTVEAVRGRIPVIAGNGSNCTSHAIELTHAVCEAGCDALLTVTPYYNKANREGLVRSFCDIADAGSVPTILYNVPSRTGISIPLSVYKDICRHERIVGVKDAGGNIKESMALISSLSDMLDVYCGNDDILFPMLSLGCIGGISVAANLIPTEMQMICDLYFSGRSDQSRELQYKLYDLIEALFCEVNPIPLKYALQQIGICEGDMRLPLYEADCESKSKIRAVLKKHNLLS